MSDYKVVKGRVCLENLAIGASTCARIINELQKENTELKSKIPECKDDCKHFKSGCMLDGPNNCVRDADDYYQPILKKAKG